MLKENIIMSIVFASDNKYSQHLCVALYSLLLHNSTHQIKIYILDGGISDDNKNKIIHSLSKFVNKKLSFISIDEYLFKDLKEVSYFSKVCYFRLLLPDLFPDLDKVLYLDCDIVVQSSILELYNTPFEDKSLLAVKEPFPEYSESLQCNLGMSSSKFCFNSGVLLMNLSHIRANAMVKKMMDFSILWKHKLLYPDQDVLNYFFVNNWKEISFVWNANHNVFVWPRNRLDTSDHQDCVLAKKHPKIIHFTGQKPRSCGYVLYPFRHKYFEYLSQTEFRDFKVKPNIREWLSNTGEYIFSKFAHVISRKSFCYSKRYLQRLCEANM